MADYTFPNVAYCANGQRAGYDFPNDKECLKVLITRDFSNR